MEKQKKYGFIQDTPSDRDYKFGAFLPYEEINPSGDWTEFLPKTEIQNKNGVEPYACVSYTILNCLETLIFKKYGIKKDYSDRFLASVSGTKEGGNSPRIVLDFLRKVGVVNEELWAFNDLITTFEQYYEKVPPKLYELAREFTEEFDLKYEEVPFEDIPKALRCSPLLVSVPAWFQDEKGEYYRPEGFQDNHATTLFKERNVFDSYDNIIKTLRQDLRYSTIKRFYIQKKTIKEQISLIQRIIDACKKAIELLFQVKKIQTEEIISIDKKIDTKVEISKYDWSDKKSIRHSIRVICDEEGLNVFEKDLVCRIAECESSLNPKARLQNSPKSIDRGLFQWNSYWHPQITDEMAYNPETATRLAIQAVKDRKVQVFWSASVRCWNKDGKYNVFLV